MRNRRSASSIATLTSVANSALAASLHDTLAFICHEERYVAMACNQDCQLCVNEQLMQESLARTALLNVARKGYDRSLQLLNQVWTQLCCCKCVSRCSWVRDCTLLPAPSGCEQCMHVKQTYVRFTVGVAAIPMSQSRSAAEVGCFERVSHQSGSATEPRVLDKRRQHI